MANNYSLYVHTSPNGKRYIGITCRIPIYRWNNGNGYKHNPYLTSAIKKYGWENFTHQVLIDGLNKASTEYLEKQFIERWNLNDRRFGYNYKSGGGANSKLSMETRRKISEALKGRKMSDETRQKIDPNRKTERQ